MKHSKGWTDNDILEALWMRQEGYKMKEIGEHFGVTKNAVIGVLHRVMKESE
jgi:predicted transcriptional regulator|tara:strand:- start:116 stop:271 length:156 start_codon:yes stop_codon:yes gene_type:complete